MKTHDSLCLALLWFLAPLLPTCLSAQTEGGSKVIECSFLYWDGIPEEKFYFRMGEDYHPMTFRHGSRAGQISLKRMAVFELYGEAENPVEGEVGYKFLASTAVPAHVDKLVFLVIVADEKEGSVYRVIAVDDSIETFPRKSFLFVNLTQKMISVEFAGETVEIKLNENATIPSKVDKKGGFIPCIMRNPEGETIYGTRLFAQPNGRELVLIRPAIREGNNRPRLKFISQHVAAPVPNPNPNPNPKP